MIVVHVINDDGGVGSVIANLARIQIKRGDRVIVVADADKNFFAKLPREVEIRMIERAKLPRMAIGYRIRRLYHQIADENPGEDIVFHCHNASTVGILSRVSNVPLVLTIHGFSVLKDEGESLTCREKMALFGTEAVIRKLTRCNKSLVGVSSAVSSYWNHRANVSSVKTIHNGCEDRGVLATPGDSFTIAHVGDLSRYKGWDILLQAFLELRRRHPSRRIRFLSAGAPLHFNSSYIAGVRKEYGIDEEDLRYLGFVDDPVTAVYSQASVAVLDSKSEGLGLTLVEALSAGVPCIGSNTGGIREIIDPGVNGFLVDYGNPSQLVDSLEKLMDDEVWRANSALAKRKFESDFSAEKMEERYRRLYLDQLGVSRLSPLNL